jgi:hypothetical protein
MHGLSDNLEVRYVNAPVAAASNTDDNSTIIDMQDYESVMFIVSITDSVAGGVATLKIEANTANSDSGMTAVSGAAATVTSAQNDDVNGTVLVAEIRNPAKRYVQGVITSATQNIAFGDTIAILKPRRLPATQGATVSDTAYVSP